MDGVVALFGTPALARLDDLLVMASAWRPDVVVHEVLEQAGSLLAHRLGIPGVVHGIGPMFPFYAHAHRRRGRGHRRARALGAGLDRAGPGPLPTLVAADGPAALARLPPRSDPAPANASRCRPGWPRPSRPTAQSPTSPSAPSRTPDAADFTTGLHALAEYDGHRDRDDGTSARPRRPGAAPRERPRRGVRAPGRPARAGRPAGLAQRVGHHARWPRHGVPQVALPRGTDQPENAALLVRAGAGPCSSPRRTTPSSRSPPPSRTSPATRRSGQRPSACATRSPPCPTPTPRGPASRPLRPRSRDYGPSTLTLGGGPLAVGRAARGARLVPPQIQAARAHRAQVREAPGQHAGGRAPAPGRCPARRPRPARRPPAGPSASAVSWQSSSLRDAPADHVHDVDGRGRRAPPPAGPPAGRPAASESRMQRTVSACGLRRRLTRSGRPRPRCGRACRRAAGTPGRRGRPPWPAPGRGAAAASRSGRSAGSPASFQVRIDSWSTHRPMTLRR